MFFPIFMQSLLAIMDELGTEKVKPGTAQYTSADCSMGW